MRPFAPRRSTRRDAVCSSIPAFFFVRISPRREHRYRFSRRTPAFGPRRTWYRQPNVLDTVTLLFHIKFCSHAFCEVRHPGSRV